MLTNKNSVNQLSDSDLYLQTVKTLKTVLISFMYKNGYPYEVLVCFLSICLSTKFIYLVY